MITSSGVPTRRWASTAPARKQELYEQILEAMLEPVEDTDEEVTD